MKEVTFKNVKCKTGGLIPRKGDAMYERYPNIEVTVEINNKRKAKEVADTLKTKLSKIEAAEKGVVKLWWYSEWKHIGDTKVDEDEVIERKMLGPAVVQRTRDIIDLIRGRLVVTQDGHKRTLRVIPSHSLDSPLSKEESESPIGKSFAQCGVSVDRNQVALKTEGKFGISG
ncbi:hypothetical protein AgCh_005608 [Apium graveolens]